MSTELEALRIRSNELGGRLGDEEALEVNAAILDLDPGDPVSTNRLGIGLINSGRAAEAVPVLERGVQLHPDDPIMSKRLEEAHKLLAKPVVGPTGKAKAKAKVANPVGTGPWSDFDPADLVNSSLSGPGRDACVRLCAASIRASEAIDASRTAVTPIKVGRRFRTIGGIFTGVGPWKDTLTVAVPTASRGLIERVRELGGSTSEPAKAVPSVQVLVPREHVEALYDDLLAAHREHLPASVGFGPPTHLSKHHPALREYLLTEADRLG